MSEAPATSPFAFGWGSASGATLFGPPSVPRSVITPVLPKKRVRDIIAGQSRDARQRALVVNANGFAERPSQSA